MLVTAAGCGGGSHTTSTGGPAGTSATTTQTTPVVRRRKLNVQVIDGDTGQVVRGAVVTAPGTTRRGRWLLTFAGRRELTVTGSAPGYASGTRRFLLSRTDRLTIRLFRSDGQWLMYGVDPGRTQAQPGIRLHPPFRFVWSRDLGSLIEYPAVVDEGIAYVNNYGGRLYALSMTTGRTLWAANFRSTAQASSPAVAGPDLIEHLKAGRVVVVDRSTGMVRWGFPVSGEIESSPVVERDVDYLGDWAGDVYALDLRSRRPRWVYHDGCKITASMAVSGGTVYFGDYCGRVVALRQSDGRVVWTASAGSPVYGTAAVVGGRVFVPSRDAGALYAFDLRGSELWRVSTGNLVYSAPAVWGGRVYFGSYTGELYCVSASTGAVLWTLNVGAPISGSPTVIDGVVYAATFAHRIVGADARTGHVEFTFPHGEYVAVSGNSGELLFYGWASVWAAKPRD